MSDLRVCEAMTRGVVSCAPDVSLRDAAKMMTDANGRALVVVDGQCGLAGIVSQTDLVNARLERPGSANWQSTPVREVMTQEVLTVNTDTLLDHAAKLMLDHKVHRLVVVDGSGAECSPIGVLSIGDIMRRLAKE